MHYLYLVHRFLICLFGIAAFVFPLWAAYMPGQVIVKTKISLPTQTVSAFSQSVIGQILAPYHIQSVKPLLMLANREMQALVNSQSLSQIYVVTLDPNSPIYEVIETLKQNPQVEYAEPNAILKADLTPDDPSFSSQSNMTQIKAPQGWSLSTGSSAVVIAIIDTGIQYTHPDLAANMWTNPGETPGNGVDDDGNGLVDDVYGYNFGDSTSTPLDTNGHGTHVAGIASAVTDNGIGVAGVGFSTRLMALKASTGSSDSLPTSAIVSAISYAVAKGAKVINMSFGGLGQIQAIADAIQFAIDNGVFPVAAAGNTQLNLDSNFVTPASVSGVFTVSAVDSNSLFASSLSNYGTAVDMAAPGVSILSTYINSGYTTLTGTSMSAPHVSGAAALILSANSAANLTTVLTETATDLGSSGKDPYYGYGLLNVQAAIQNVLPPTASGIVSGDFASLSSVVTVNMENTVTVTPSTIQAAISNPTFNQTLTMSSSALSFSSPYLFIDLSKLSGLSAGATTFQVTATGTDSSSVSLQFTLNLTNSSETFTLTGPSGAGSRVLNYPNPFTSTTAFAFQVSHTAAVTISIYDLYGRRIKTLSQTVPIGYNEIVWTGTDEGGAKVPNGAYLAIFQATGNGRTEIRKLKVAFLR